MQSVFNYYCGFACDSIVYMRYEFDKVINRLGTNAMSAQGFREYLFSDNPEIMLPYADEEMVSMWIADMDFAIAPEIIAAIKNRLDNQILGYSQIFDPEYNKSFLHWTSSRYGYKFETEHLVNSQGVVPALFDLIKYICKSDEKVLISTPSYGFFKHATDANNVSLVFNHLNCHNGHYYIDFDDLKQKTQDKQVTLFILCNPHNPTGRVWTLDELTQIGRICLDNNVTIITDEIHCDLLRKGQEFTPIAKLFPDTDQIITCMAPSKTFNLAGLMFANIIIPNDELRIKWIDDHTPIVNPLSLAGAQAAYTHGTSWLVMLCKYLDDNFVFLKDFLQENLPKAIYQIPQSTYLAWINLHAYCPKQMNLTEFFAQNAGVLLEGGDMFVANADGCIRLNLACPRIKLNDALNKLTEAIREQI